MYKFQFKFVSIHEGKRSTYCRFHDVAEELWLIIVSYRGKNHKTHMLQMKWFSMETVIFPVTGYNQRVALSTKKQTFLRGSIDSVPPRCSHNKCNVTDGEMSCASQTLIKGKKRLKIFPLGVKLMLPYSEHSLDC